MKHVVEAIYPGSYVVKFYPIFLG